MAEQISRAADSEALNMASANAGSAEITPAWRAFYVGDLLPLLIAALLAGAAFLPAGTVPAAATVSALAAVILSFGTARGFSLPHPRLAIGLGVAFALLSLVIVAFGFLHGFALLACLGVFAVFVAEMFLGDSRRDLLRQLAGSYIVLSLSLSAMLWPIAYEITGGRGGVLAAASALAAAGLARLLAGGRLAEHRPAGLALYCVAGVVGGIAGVLLGGALIPAALLGVTPWWLGLFGALLTPVYLIVDELFVVPSAARANVGIQLMPIALGGALACALAALVA